MSVSLRELGELVRALREERNQTQQDVATMLELSSRTTLAHLEQGRRVPSSDVLERICMGLSVPSSYWKPFLDNTVRQRHEFEDVLSELVGRPVALRHHDQHTIGIAQDSIVSLFNTENTHEQIYDHFCSVLVYYDVRRPNRAFFKNYLGANVFASVEKFKEHVERYQIDAIRLFSSFSEAYIALSQAKSLDSMLSPLKPHLDESYRARTPWNVIEVIEKDRLADLGYISAARVRKEQAEREFLSNFLVTLAKEVEKEGRQAIERYSAKKRRKIGSFLRKFDSSIHHDLMSPLFLPDADNLRRESERLAPKGGDDLQRMEDTQFIGQRNLSRYLAADYLDVYVATSMRSDADFASVNEFVTSLFSSDEVRPLKLRFFNPTQSWIEDRVAKGLVEALMLKRADITIYMAQKTDTFGKDSEASVALGQGKPVVVYVPRLYVPEAEIDSEALGLKTKSDLQGIITAEAAGEDAEIDETTDHQALLAQVLSIRLNRVEQGALQDAVHRHWADFDLYGEAGRIEDEKERAAYRAWLDSVLERSERRSLDEKVRQHVIGIFVAVATNFEKRATVFREVHPLALQVILSTGVLNGILVVRSIERCAGLLASLVQNKLDLQLDTDEQNYRLKERITGSTIRVISRHRLIANAFSSFYTRMREK